MFKSTKEADGAKVRNAKMALAYLESPGSENPNKVSPRVRVVVKESTFNGDVFVVSDGVQTVSNQDDKIETSHATCNQFDLGSNVNNPNNGNDRIMQCVLPPRWSGHEYQYKVYNYNGSTELNAHDYATYVT